MMICKWNSANTTFPVGWGTTRFCQSPRSCSANRCFFLPKENAPVIREDGCNKCLRIMITSRFNFRLKFKVKETDIRNWPWIDWFFFNMSTLDAFVIWRFPIGHIHMYIYINHQNILKRFNTHIYIYVYTHISLQYVHVAILCCITFSITAIAINPSSNHQDVTADG